MTKKSDQPKEKPAGGVSSKLIERILSLSKSSSKENGRNSP